MSAHSRLTFAFGRTLLLLEDGVDQLLLGHAFIHVALYLLLVDVLLRNLDIEILFHLLPRVSTHHLVAANMEVLIQTHRVPSAEIRLRDKFLGFWLNKLCGLWTSSIVLVHIGRRVLQWIILLLLLRLIILGRRKLWPLYWRNVVDILWIR